jgi:glycine/D-amino acid oxidase-like deaminating enzyme
MQAHIDLAEELGDAPWRQVSGNLVWITDDSDAADLEGRVARLRGWDYPAEWLDPARVAELEPGLRPEDDVEQFAFFPTEGWIAGPLLARAMTEHAAALGATLRFGAEVTAILRDAERVSGVRLANGEELHADVVVNCAGPGADRIAALVGRTLPLAPTTGFVTRVAGGHGAISRVIHAPRVHMRPDDSGLIALHHGDADAGVDRGESPYEWAKELLRRAGEYVPALQEARISRWSVTTRPIPADERTCAGMVTAIPGYAEVVTHSGITLGPLLATLVSRELLDGEVDSLLQPFRPDRFTEN